MSDKKRQPRKRTPKPKPETPKAQESNTVEAGQSVGQSVPQ